MRDFPKMQGNSYIWREIPYNKGKSPFIRGNYPWKGVIPLISGSLPPYLGPYPLARGKYPMQGVNAPISGSIPL